MPVRGTSALPTEEDAFTTGEPSVWGGIIAGTVEDFGTALDVTPARFLEAMRDARVRPMVDTARRGEKSKEHHHDRPDDPERRSLAFEVEDLGEITDALSTTDLSR
jgi:hypothetical protein